MRNGRCRHIAAGGIQKNVDSAVFLHDFGIIVLQDSLVQNIGREKDGFSSGCLYFGYDVVGDGSRTLKIQNDDLGSLGCKILYDSGTKNPACAGHYRYLAPYIKQIFHNI